MRANKKLLAMAVAMLPVTMMATAAQATEVKLYGLMDAYVGGDKLNGDSRMVVDSSGMTTSFWGIGGSEDLGGGLKAIFAAEAFIRNDTGEAGRYNGDGYFARSAYVGFDGGFGRATFGRNTTPYFLNTIIFNPFGDSFVFSPMVLNTFIGAGNAIVQGDTGFSNSLSYSSPSFGGFKVNLLGSLGQERYAEPRKTGRAVDAQVTYGTGPFSLGIVGRKLYLDSVTTGLESSQTSFQVGAAYDLKVAKLYAQYQQQKLANEGAVDQKAKTWQIGASVPVGAGSVLVSYVRTKYDDMPTFGEKRDTAAIGYDYYLSKRTDVYAMFAYDRTDSTDVFAGNKQQKIGFGVRHRF